MWLSNNQGRNTMSLQVVVLQDTMLTSFMMKKIRRQVEARLQVMFYQVKLLPGSEIHTVVKKYH